MKYVLVFLSACLIMFSASQSFAKPSEHLNWGIQINQSQCPSGTLVINVVQKVVNSIDSGLSGNWALDNYVRQIQVVDTGSGTFCATVSYQGDFTTLAGPSPNNTGTVGAGVVGTFQGGYIANITGALLPTPTQKTKGSIGTIDYGCNTDSTCPGIIDWKTWYFTVTTSDITWWGWTYHAGNNGSWVDASSGIFGDITGN